MRTKHNFIKTTYVTCDSCGYNNKKDRFQAYGTCLGCGKILDDKVYFKAQLIKKSFRKAKITGTKISAKHLIF